MPTRRGPGAWAAMGAAVSLVAAGLGLGIPISAPAGAAPVGAWAPTAPLPSPRASHTATLLANGKVLVTGGVGTGGNPKAAAFLYDPASATWAATGSMAAARKAHTASRLADGRVLVVGGLSPSPDGTQLVDTTSAEIYDPATGTWAPTGSLSPEGGRSAHTATVLASGHVLVAGGSSQTAPPGEKLATAELFDPATGAWAPVGSMAFGRESHTASLLANGDVLVVGGYRGTDFDASPTGPFAAPEVFRPASGTWELTTPNVIRRFHHSATTLPDGSVLITGGWPATPPGDVPPTPSSELYEPATPDRPARWRPVGSLANPRAQHTATLLPGGRVLVVGGLGPGPRDNPGPVASAELYDPDTQRWSDAGARSAALARATATLLDAGSCGANCGRVLVSGGSPGFDFFPGDEAQSNADLYAPPPEVRALSPSSGPVAGGNTVIITGTGFAGATAVRFGGVDAVRFSVDSPTQITAVAPAHAPGPVDVVVTTPLGPSQPRAVARYLYSASISPPGSGYWLTASDGGVFAFGEARFFGSTGAIRLNQPVVAMASTPSGNGYWLVASDGGVFAFGDARFLGSTWAIRLNKPMVGMAATPTGLGYWLVASDGGVFAFGDARFRGSTGAIRLNQPVVAMATSPTGNGYWLVASDGGVFAFGDARFFGSTGALRLNRPMVGMAGSASGNGYWLVASDGGVFAFGDARFVGSTGALRLNQPMVAMAASRSGNGYWLVASDGGVFAFGDARFLGSTGALRLNKPMVGMAARSS